MYFTYSSFLIISPLSGFFFIYSSLPFLIFTHLHSPCFPSFFSFFFFSFFLKLPSSSSISFSLIFAFHLFFLYSLPFFYFKVQFTVSILFPSLPFPFSTIFLHLSLPLSLSRSLSFPFSLLFPISFSLSSKHSEYGSKTSHKSLQTKYLEILLEGVFFYIFLFLPHVRISPSRSRKV